MAFSFNISKERFRILGIYYFMINIPYVKRLPPSYSILQENKDQISDSFLDHTISTQSINFLNIFTYSYVIL